MGLPTVIIPGYLAAAQDYLPLQDDLIKQSMPTVIVPLRQSSWLPTLGGRPVTPILQAIAHTIEQTCRIYGTTHVNLIGHSAGGWIARILLGEKPYFGHTWGLHAQVATLVTLGTPHLSQERFTRTNMEFVNMTYPGAFQPQVRYVCLAGRAVEGRNNWFTRQSYQLTCGDGDTWGDGITPITSAHLAGAKNLTLERVFHSPRGGRFWYGSPKALAQWMAYIC